MQGKEKSKMTGKKQRLPRRMLPHPPRNGDFLEIASLRLAKGKKRIAQWSEKRR